MNGILAQAAALAAHARARRADSHLGGDDAYWNQHSTFKYVRSVRFAQRRRRLLIRTERVVATSPAQWLTTLPVDADVALVAPSTSIGLAQHLATALAGGTKNGIAVFTRHGTEVWSSKWKTSGGQPADRIWAVRYVMAASRLRQTSPVTLVEAREQLATALAEVDEFVAGDASLSAWHETFDKAAQNLHASNPVAPYHPDILPREGYSLSARQLLAAAVAAYVFGGMGSWNDMMFQEGEAQRQYETVTKRLYTAVIDGLLAAVNRGMPGESG